MSLRCELSATRNAVSNHRVDIDLQNVLQKQQQLLQMLSNISKEMSDTACPGQRRSVGAWATSAHRIPHLQAGK